MTDALTFDTDRYLRLQQAAVASAAPLAAAVDSLGDRLRNVFFLGVDPGIAPTGGIGWVRNCGVGLGTYESALDRSGAD